MPLTPNGVYFDVLDPSVSLDCRDVKKVCCVSCGPDCVIISSLWVMLVSGDAYRQESESEEFRKLSADYVRRETWKMFHKLQPFIFKGCTSVLLKAKKFQYCYRLWFEDENSVWPPLFTA